MLCSERNGCVRLDAVPLREPAAAVPFRIFRAISREVSALPLKQVMYPQVVLVDHMIILHIVLPFIVWTALVLQCNIRLLKTFIVPIPRDIGRMWRKSRRICNRPADPAVWIELSRHWIVASLKFPIHIGVISCQRQRGFLRSLNLDFSIEIGLRILGML